MSSDVSGSHARGGNLCAPRTCADQPQKRFHQAYLWYRRSHSKFGGRRARKRIHLLQIYHDKMRQMKKELEPYLTKQRWIERLEAERRLRE